ncbi:putative protein [Arabidopsis thaliana]|nr:putative protein [Arabidopsis thaliana]CAB79908.1 putative protein [Arabidopsis thaliana]
MANLLQRLRRRTGPKPDYIEDKLDEYIREEQVEETGGSNQDCPLGEIEKILDREWRPTASNNPNSSDNGTPTLVVVKQYLVKWKGLSYLHCSWVPEQEFEKAYKSHPHLKLKLRVTRFNAAMDVFIAENGAHEFIAIRPEWKTVDRIIACREGDDGEEYLVKYKELSYRNSYWESESDISDFQNEIQRFKDINSSSRRDKYVENERNREEFKQFDLTPEFLTGTLHTYQLEGLNFLRYSWSKKTNVILADEMGLGKTIQSIAFLASLFEENLSPHLVVAPLSTIRNWEREFATWAPHMNVVMYTGDSEARDVIWEHEFYFSEGRKRLKKDVLKDKVPPKKELILRVDMSSQQKEVYKAVITNNYQVLTKKRDAKISNVLMKLRQVCSHPYLLPDFEPRFEDANEAFTKLLEASGKLQLLDKMMVKLKEQGHRVLIYTQFQHTLYLLEDYFTFKNWNYERIDGKISGPERQVRIDRFNAENSNRFCFLLSTRAGGIGINLATADTVIIYDSDWNPHADLQAMARVHRLGQTNKVMIYRLIHKGTVEERMMEITKNKMLLEHLVVGKQHLCQDELDDIIKYGSKELFSEENDEAGRSGKIHYDDAAIEQLLDRNHVDAVEVSLDDEEETDFLKNFKVASFEYVDDENEAAALEEAQAIENNSSVRNADRTSHWKDLLKDKYEVQQAEELSALGKRKRNGKQVMYAEDDLDGLEEISDEEDEYCLDDLKVTSDEEEEADEPEAARQRKPRTVTRPYRKRARDNSEEIPLMEGEGRYLMVLGFNETERDIFLRTFKRYGILFLKHIAENPTDNSTNFKVITAMVYADGVPKEGISSDELLVSMTFMMLVKEKCQFLDNHPTAPVFSNYVISKYNLRNGAFSKEEHDRILIPAVSKHGYGRWVAIVEDEEIGFQEVACKDLNIPFPPDTKSARKRICDHVGKRVKKMEDAIKYEYAEKILAEQAKAETKGTSFVDAEKEMLKNDPITSKKNSATAVDNKQGRVEMAQSYDQSVNEKSGESFQTYLDIQPLNRMPRESFKPLEPINEEISTRLSVGTDHDVEMDAADNIIVLD